MDSEIRLSSITDLSKMSSFANGVYKAKYSFQDEENNPIEEWADTALRVVSNVMESLGYGPDDWEFKKLLELITLRKFIPGGRYLYASGRPLHQTQNCLLLRADDSREGWADLMRKSAMALQTGAGIGIDYSDVRPSGSLIRKTGGVSSGPISLAKIINEIGRNVMQGGQRRSAIWAGLNWKHGDVYKFINSKNWPEVVVKQKEKDFFFPADLDMTNISVLLDDQFFLAFDDENFYLLDEDGKEVIPPKHESWHKHARDVYDLTVRSMISTAEPGFSIDVGENTGETLRNACTEITSYDDSDICNLGSINLARIENVEEFDEVVQLSTLFLLAGTVYSHVPYEKVDEIRTKNRRLGLGLMGIHEWLLLRGKKYGPDDELAEWLNVYENADTYAIFYSDLHKLTRPAKTRAIAPTGTIGIIGETTTGIEPILCAAYKRRVRSATPDGDLISYQYVVDPTAKRLLDNGVDPNHIEDSYTLAFDVERRIEFQSWVQKWVDHAISSTINLPYAIIEEEEVQDFKEILINYLPKIRGITVYPDGARAGQPLTPVDLKFALSQEGNVFEETTEESCRNGVCGI